MLNRSPASVLGGEHVQQAGKPLPQIGLAQHPEMVCASRFRHRKTERGAKPFRPIGIGEQGQHHRQPIRVGQRRQHGPEFHIREFRLVVRHEHTS